MARMTGGEAIVDGLLRHGIDTVFGLPGVQVYGLFDAFALNANRLRLINARHEQTTAYMALVHLAGNMNPIDHPQATSGLPFMVQRKGFAMVSLKYEMNPSIRC